jgi:hypothetical protein
LSKEDFSQTLANLYNKYGNLIFSLNFDVLYDGSSSLDDLIAS